MSFSVFLRRKESAQLRVYCCSLSRCRTPSLKKSPHPRSLGEKHLVLPRIAQHGHLLGRQSDKPICFVLTVLPSAEKFPRNRKKSQIENVWFGLVSGVPQRKRYIALTIDVVMYLADRQISLRMGQSFWSRGPSLSTKFTASDFPSLQPESTGEDDHAAVLQATVELTQLLHNVHDIIYTSKSRTMEIMLMGDYSRYLDDFLKALAAWDQIWGTLEVSPKLRCTLRLIYEYLCLYVNAFSLQAVISRSAQSQRDMRWSGMAAQSLFPRGVMASPDGRFIFEAVRAAKNILKLFADMDAEVHLRYLPSRFYL